MNNDYPILVFPKHETADRTKKPVNPPPPKMPSAKENWKRLEPTFKTLQETLNNRRMQLQDVAEGANPEDILVLETAGRIDDFYKAVELVDGLEWMLEQDKDGQPDDDFYFPDDEGNPTYKALPSRVYLVSANNEALREMVSLFRRYGKDGEPLPRGYGKFKVVFDQLRDIRFWDNQDRMDGIDVTEWVRNHEGEEKVRLQIELWFRKSFIKRNEAHGRVRTLVEACGGRLVKSCVIPEIRYHALLVEVAGETLGQLLTDMEEGSLIKCTDIMFFKAMPQMVVSPGDDEAAMALDKVKDDPLPKGSPVVALLDGYPLENHKLLEHRLFVDDPDVYNDGQYEVKYRIHGTEMASLIIHGDMSNPGAAIDTPLYVRPIMRPNFKSNKEEEQIPDNVLLVDLIHRAVKRMIEGENDAPPVAPDVKIINFSIGDQMRMFYRSMSPLARLLDWLSYYYEVLFIISAGNNYQVIPTGCSYAEFAQKSQEEISKLVSKELLKARMQNRLLSPAESMNNITVGAVHRDETVIPTYPIKVNPYDCLHPAIYTPFGGGLKNSIKPDFVFDGGRELLKEEIMDHNNIYPSLYRVAPGLWAAWPDKTACGMKFDRGTSGAAALVSRAAYRCYKEMEELLNINGMPDSHIHLLIKAMLAHGCSWDEVAENIDKYLPAVSDAKAAKRQWIGYGYPRFEKSLACDANRVTVIGFSELKSEEAHVYSMPLPPSMSNQKIKRRLTVTLAWMTPMAFENQKYRRIKLWVEPDNVKRIVGDRIDVADNNAAKRGTLQHEVFEGEKRFSLEKDAVLKLKVNCADDAGGFKEGIKYAFAVTLEFAPATTVDLFADNAEIDYYQEVRDRLRVPVSVPIH